MHAPRAFLGGLFLLPGLLLADFSYTKTTRMTGGSLLQMSQTLGRFSKGMRNLTEPQTQTVLLQGNRLGQIDDKSAQIWDLDSQTITSIDFEKKTFSRITFAEMREAMEKAMARANAKMKEAQAKSKNQDSPDAQLDYKFEVKETGKTRMIEGMNAHEVLMIMGADITDRKSGQKAGAMETVSSVWLVEKVPGYEELEQFYRKMATAMSGMFGSALSQQNALMMMNPQIGEAAQRMAKEAEKLKGFQVLTIMKFGTNIDRETASRISDPSTQPAGPSAGEVAGDAAGSEAENQTVGRLGRRLGIGGLGGFGRRNKDKDKEKEEEQRRQAQAQAAQNQQASGVLMEMVEESSRFSTAPVDSARLNVPAGFKEVEHEMKKLLRN